MQNLFSKFGRGAWLFFIPCTENNYRPKSLDRRAFAVYIIAALVLKLGVISIVSFFPRTLLFADVTSSALVSLTNEMRQKSGLVELQPDALLTKAAQEKANDLLAKGYFAHESPDGKTPWYWFRQAGYRYLYAGENLAKDFVDSDAIVAAWLASPLHRANILNENYRDIGIAVAAGSYDTSGKQTVMVVQLFGKPYAVPAPTRSPVPAPSPAPVLAASPAATPAASGLAVAATPSPIPTPSSDIATSEPFIPADIVPQAETTVAGSAVSEETISKPVAKHLVFAGRLMTSAEKMAENAYLMFLLFVLLASLLNIFIRVDIQHPDLVARAFALLVIFFLLAAFQGMAFTSYVPQVL